MYKIWVQWDSHTWKIREQYTKAASDSLSGIREETGDPCAGLGGDVVREEAGAGLQGGVSLGRQWRACQNGVAAFDFLMWLGQRKVAVGCTLEEWRRDIAHLALGETVKAVLLTKPWGYELQYSGLNES